MNNTNILVDCFSCSRRVFGLHSPDVVFGICSEDDNRAVPFSYVFAYVGCETVVNGCGIHLLLRYVAKGVRREITTGSMTGYLDHVVGEIIRSHCAAPGECDFSVEVAIVGRVRRSDAVKADEMPIGTVHSPVECLNRDSYS